MTSNSPSNGDDDTSYTAGGIDALEYNNAAGPDGANGDTGYDSDDLDDSFDMLANVPATPGQTERLHGDVVGDVQVQGEASLSGLLGIEDSPDPADVVAGPPSTQGLRRSPRLAAARRGTMGPGGLYGGLPKSEKKGGGGVGGDGGSGVTPYSGRRRVRRQSRGFAVFTPGSAYAEAGTEETNASFRTAIMGDGSPADSAEPGSNLRGALFADTDGERSVTYSEGTPSAAATGTLPGRYASAMDAAGAEVELNALEAFMANLTLGEEDSPEAPEDVLADEVVDGKKTWLGEDREGTVQESVGGLSMGREDGEGTMQEKMEGLSMTSLVEHGDDGDGVDGVFGATTESGSGPSGAGGAGIPDLDRNEIGHLCDTPAASSSPFAPPSPDVHVPINDGERSFSSKEADVSADGGGGCPRRPPGRNDVESNGAVETCAVEPSCDEEDLTAAFAAVGGCVGGAADVALLPVLPPAPPLLISEDAALTMPPPLPPHDDGPVRGVGLEMKVPSVGGDGGRGAAADDCGVFADMVVDAAAVGNGNGREVGTKATVSSVQMEANAMGVECVEEEEGRAAMSAVVAPSSSVMAIGKEEVTRAVGKEEGAAAVGSEGTKKEAAATHGGVVGSGGASQRPRANPLIASGRRGSSVSGAPAVAGARPSAKKPTTPTVAAVKKVSARPASPVRRPAQKVVAGAAGGSGVGVGPGASAVAAVVSTVAARRVAAVGRRDSAVINRRDSAVAGKRDSVVGRRSVAGGSVAVSRRQSLAIGAPVSDAAGEAVGAGATRASSRGRDRGTRERASVGFGRGRDGSTGPTKAAAPAAPAPVVAPVASTSRLLAPTKLSQRRARPRSASPAVPSVRGRSSVAGVGGTSSGPRMSTGTRRASTAGASQQPQQKPRAQSTGRRALTTPKMPNLRTSVRVKAAEKPQETTEETEFRKQQEMQKEMKQMTRRNQVAMERSRRTAYTGNVRSSKPLTVPESPAMKTIGRLGGKVYAAVGSQVDQEGFSPTHPAKDDPLTKERPVQAAAQPKGPTVPAPFRLSQSNRPGRGGPSTPRSREETLTFRESLSRIENKTPDRFRTMPAGEQPKPAPGTHVEAKPTLPVSPRFRTEARAAGYSKSHVMSREEREEAELADMKKHQFKARPFRADGFGVGGEQGVFRPQHSDKQLTQPAPFRLSTDGRASKRAPSPHRSRDEEELSKQFKARPMPSGRSSSVGRVRPGAKVGPGSAAELKPRELTVAESPLLSTKRRSALRSSSIAGIPTSEQAELDEAASKQFRARPMPDYSKLASQGESRRQSSVVPAEQSISLTEPRPFHLRSEERGKAKQALLAKRLETQRKQEEVATRVRARPLPPPSHGFFPQPSERRLTETTEFCLSSQARHERAAEEFRQRVRREEERARRATEVTALPLPAATFEPEPYPERTEVSLTQPVEVVLHSTARAEGRAQWESENQARLDAEEQARVEQAEATAAAEKRAILELRRRSHADGGMSFKATPIMFSSAAPECAQLSSAPLTTPITPNLRTKRRAMAAVPRETAPLA